jgi:pilus assembly protein CpaF
MIPSSVYSETLLQFLAPVRAYLEDATVAEVMINGPDQIYIERRGKLERVPAKFDSEEAILCALRNAAQFIGKELDELHPILEARMPDGSRLQGIIPPVAPGGPYVSIRRFSTATFSPEVLLRNDSFTVDACETLRALVVAKFNVLVAGGTGSGKTSFLNMLTNFVPEDERIAVIEDSKEVQVQRQHVFSLEARAADPEGQGAVSIRELFRATLRMRPDRIIIGEIRGGEALDIVQAMVSGHGGCLGTLHATYPRDTLTRLETMALMSDVEVPLLALRLQIASGVNFIAQVARLRDGSRKLTHLTEVLGFDAASGKYLLQDIFVRNYASRDGSARRGNEEFMSERLTSERLVSELIPTGYLPSRLDQLAQHGVRLPSGVIEAEKRRGGLP